MKNRFFHKICKLFFTIGAFIAAPIGLWYIVVCFGGDESLAWFVGTTSFFLLPLAMAHIISELKSTLKESVQKRFSETMLLFNDYAQA